MKHLPGKKHLLQHAEHKRTPVFSALLSLLYPERCLVCRRLLGASSAAPLCSTCAVTFNYAGYICPFCEKSGSLPPDCGCRPAWYPLKSLFCLSFYEKGWRDMLHDLKFNERKSLARPLGLWLGSELVKNKGRPVFDLVVPVPLHRLKERQRGYNQSEILARHVAKALGLPCVNLLERTRNTISQTTLSRLERRENIKGAFKPAGNIKKGARVLLVDDIYSTGSTMTEAAAVLKKAGANVFGAAAAYNRRYRGW